VAGPPLLLLHGTGGDEHELLPLRDLLAPGAAVLLVRGTVLENGMPRFFRRLPDGVFDEDDLRRQAADLATFVEAASTAYGIDAGSLVAVGFSNGANTAAALVVVPNGRRDPMIPLGLTARLVEELRERGAEAVELAHPGGHQIHPDVLPQVRALLGA